MTVAAQQRAEAAYRRQRMAQERAEQTAVWRAEMEVERARMLKEVSGGGSRRSSNCKELEDLKERAPEGRLFCEKKYLQSKIVGTFGQFPPLPLHKVENSSDFPKRNLLSTLQRGKGSTLCSLKNRKCSKVFLTGDVAVTLGCLRRAGHENVDSSLKRTTRVGSIVNSRLADTSLLRTPQQYRQSFDLKKKSSYCGISLPGTLTDDPERLSQQRELSFFWKIFLFMCHRACQTLPIPRSQ